MMDDVESEGVPRRRGRPTRLTSERARMIVASVSHGARPNAAAGAAGVPRATFQQWRARGSRAITGREQHQTVQRSELAYLHLEAEIRRAEATFEVMHTIQITKATDWRAAAFLLERRFPASWGRHAATTEPHQEEPDAIDRDIRAAVQDLRLAASQTQTAPLDAPSPPRPADP